MKKTSLPLPISALFFAAVFLFSLVAISAPVNAEVGNFTFNQTNSTLVNSRSNISISFTFPRAFVICNISIAFPSKYALTGTTVHNTTALPIGITLTTIGGAVNGQNLSYIIDNPNNVTANTTFLGLNVSVTLPKINSSETLSIYPAYSVPADTGCGNRIDGAPTTFTFANLADRMVNLTVGISQVNNVTRAVNLSGNTFNVTATAQDQFGNTNESGGFNFQQNDTTVLTYFAGLGGGNGTFFTLFNATKNGTATINVSSVIATRPPDEFSNTLWNHTGVNATVLANVIVGMNVTYNATSVVAGNVINLTATGFDVNGNLNNSGGFNYHVANNTLSGATYLSGNSSINGSFQMRGNGTFAFNVSAALNSSAWNVSIAQNVTVTSDDVAFINVTYNSTSIVAGQRINLTGLPFDRFGNLNFSGGLNFSLANNTLGGVSYVEGNSSFQGAFNITRNGTFAFNVSARLNQSASNVSLFQNVTVTSANILYVNVTSFSGYPTYSNSTVSQSVNGTFNLTAFAVDRFGNLNFTGGFNFQGSNHSVASYVSGNATIYGVFNTTQTGTATLTVYSVQDATITNASVTLNSTVHPNVTGIYTSAITTAGAAVGWNTHENSTTFVEYGLDSNYGTNTSQAESLTVHNITIAGLLAGTVYHYRVHVCSAFNLCSFSDNGKFQTNTKSLGGGATGAGATGLPGAGNESIQAVLSVSPIIRCPDGLEIGVTSDAGIVQGANVTLSSPTGENSYALTDGRGIANFSLPSLGAYSLRVEKSGFAPYSTQVAFNELSCRGQQVLKLEMAGKIFCPNVFQVEVLYWGNNPVRDARVEAKRKEFGRLGADGQSRLAATQATDENGFANFTLGRPRRGIYEYTLTATADGFLQSEPIVIAYEAGGDSCISAGQQAVEQVQLRQAPRSVATQAVDLIEAAIPLPIELPEGEAADTVVFVIAGVVTLGIAAGLYRLVSEILALQGPPKMGSDE